MGAPRAQVPGVVLVVSSYGGRRFTQFLLCDERMLLVDSGMAGWVGERIEPQLSATGLSLMRVDFVLNTHADVDHYGGNAELRRMVPGMILMAHRADAPLIERWGCMVSERLGVHERCGQGYASETMGWLETAAGPSTRLDVLLRGSEVLRLGVKREVEIVHLPGHSRGMVGVWDRSYGVLIAADAALGRGMVNEAGVLDGPPPYFDVVAYRRSLRKMLTFDFQWLLLTHHPVMNRACGLRFLEDSLAHIDAMESVIRECLADPEGPVRFRDIFETVETRFGPYAVMPNELCAPIRAHLEDLRRRGLAALVRGQKDDEPVWRGCGEGVNATDGRR